LHAVVIVVFAATAVVLVFVDFAICVTAILHCCCSKRF
ncbi:hypothetical protein DOY81_000767, partial [Sarcophaga bullata]